LEDFGFDFLHQGDLARIGCGSKGVVNFVMDCRCGFEEFEGCGFIECGDFSDVEDIFEHFCWLICKI
jgi:hypothetical protein